MKPIFFIALIFCIIGSCIWIFIKEKRQEKQRKAAGREREEMIKEIIDRHTNG